MHDSSTNGWIILTLVTTDWFKTRLAPTVLLINVIYLISQNVISFKMERSTRKENNVLDENFFFLSKICRLLKIVKSITFQANSTTGLLKSDKSDCKMNTACRIQAPWLQTRSKDYVCDHTAYSTLTTKSTFYLSRRKKKNRQRNTHLSVIYLMFDLYFLFWCCWWTSCNFLCKARASRHINIHDS